MYFLVLFCLAIGSGSNSTRCHIHLTSMRHKPSTVSALVWLAPVAKMLDLECASETSPVWRDHKDVQKLNKLFMNKKRDWGSSCEWGDNQFCIYDALHAQVF